MRVLSVINLKGGVAKTTTSINFAYILSAVHGYRVLIIDNDKQGDASRQLNRRSVERKGTEEIMRKRKPDMHRIIQKTEIQNMDIITANMKLLRANKEVMLDQSRPQIGRIRAALKTIESDYDFAIIDNAPDINILTINALEASNDVIVPLEIDDNTTEGLPELLEQIQETKEGFNESLTFQGCLITKYNARNQAHVQGKELLENTGTRVFTTCVRVSDKVAESTFCRMPVSKYSIRSAAAVDYRKAVKEYLEKVSNLDREGAGYGERI